MKKHTMYEVTIHYFNEDKTITDRFDEMALNVLGEYNHIYYDIVKIVQVIDTKTFLQKLLKK